MTAGSVKLNAEWRAFLDAMDPKAFQTRLAKGLVLAGARVGRTFQRDARARIRGRDYAPNSPVTVILKGSNAPLVDKGDLFQSITFGQPDPYNLRLGIMRQAVGEELVNVAMILHEGCTVDVRRFPQVRRKVFAMLRDRLSAERLAALTPRSRKAVKGAAAILGMSSPARRAAFASMRRQGKAGMAPIGSGSQVWITPGRPFITRPLETPEFGRVVVDAYGQAVRVAFGGSS